MRAAVDDIDVMEGHSVHNLLAFLQLTFGTLDEFDLWNDSHKGLLIKMKKCKKKKKKKKKGAKKKMKEKIFCTKLEWCLDKIIFKIICISF